MLQFFWWEEGLNLCDVELEKKVNCFGFSSFKLKIIAAISMTIDHMGALWSINLVSENYVIFRVIGRVAAPLFLFVYVQSFQHTSSKYLFLKRLYLGGMCVGLSDTLINFLFGNAIGVHTFGNMFFSFFCIGVYIEIIDKLLLAIRKKSFRKILKIIIFGGISFVPCVSYETINQLIPKGTQIEYKILFQGIRDALFPSAFHTEYGMGFIVLGIVLYFLKTKARQCLCFLGFCGMCICGTIISSDNIYMISSFACIFFNQLQCYMILALPFMIMYNGEEGRKRKMLFYLYYPIHRYLLVLCASLQ